MCRGCRLHFMLRPVCLLPAARLAPPRRLLTPRLGDEVSPARLGPATRRTGAYRGGTFTRWKRAACRLRLTTLRPACGATHHERILVATATCGSGDSARGTGRARSPKRGGERDHVGPACREASGARTAVQALWRAATRGGRLPGARGRLRSDPVRHRPARGGRAR